LGGGDYTAKAAAWLPLSKVRGDGPVEAFGMQNAHLRRPSPHKQGQILLQGIEIQVQFEDVYAGLAEDANGTGLRVTRDKSF
jgi:hypothetical protein